jgi:putative pyruvate formate lyase activating enzyme
MLHDASAYMPSYLRLPSAGLVEKVKAAEATLKSCTLCPRECRVDRSAGKFGFCRTGDMPFVSSWGPHFGGECPLAGTHDFEDLLR